MISPIQDLHKWFNKRDSFSFFQSLCIFLYGCPPLPILHIYIWDRALLDLPRKNYYKNVPILSVSMLSCQTLYCTVYSVQTYQLTMYIMLHHTVILTHMCLYTDRTKWGENSNLSRQSQDIHCMESSESYISLDFQCNAVKKAEEGNGNIQEDEHKHVHKI